MQKLDASAPEILAAHESFFNRYCVLLLHLLDFSPDEVSQNPAFEATVHKLTAFVIESGDRILSLAPFFQLIDSLFKKFQIMDSELGHAFLSAALNSLKPGHDSDTWRAIAATFGPYLETMPSDVVDTFATLLEELIDDYGGVNPLSEGLVDFIRPILAIEAQRGAEAPTLTKLDQFLTEVARAQQGED
jgi:hypothetical protein